MKSGKLSEAKPYEVNKSYLDTVIVALNLFTKIGLIYLHEDGIFRIPAVADMVGSELVSAERKRKSREIQQKKVPQICDSSVTMSQNDKEQCHTDIDIDIEIEIDKELEINKYIIIIIGGRRRLIHNCACDAYNGKLR